MRKILYSFFVLLFSFSLLHAQENIPYTRYGLGLLNDPDFSYLKGWGDLSAAYHNPFRLNVANPASYGYIATTTFEGGLYGSALQLQAADSSQVFADGSVSHLAFGFPIMKNKWGLSLGVLPYSRVSYNLAQINDSTTEFGQSYNYFEGKGSLYRFYGGTGFRIKDFSFGINAAYLFGNITYDNTLAFDDTVNALFTRKQESRDFGDFVFDAGAQYQINLKKQNDKTFKYSILIGVNGNMKTSVATKRNVIYDRLIPPTVYGVVNPIPLDTIYESLGEKGETILPATCSAGIIFSRNGKYSFGVNYQYASWSQYQSFGVSEFNANSSKVGLGVELIPDLKAYLDYWKTVAYRVGFNYGTDYIQYGGQSFPQYSFSLGGGFPLRARIVTQASKLDLAFQYIKTGNTTTNPLAFTAYRLYLGFTLNERWFQKPKFD